MWNDRRRIKRETKMILNKEWRYCIRSCFWDVRHRLCQQFSLQPNLSNKKINSTRRSIVASGFWQFLYLKLHHIMYLRNKFRIINSNSQLYKIRIWSRRKIHRRKRWELSDAGVLIEEARVRTRITQKSIFLTPHAMRDSFEKGFFRVWWSITSEWMGIPKKKKKRCQSCHILFITFAFIGCSAL